MNRQPYMTILRNMHGFNRSVAYLIALALVGLLLERIIYYTLVDNDIIEAETPAEQLHRLAPHKAKQLGIPDPNAYKNREQTDEEQLSQTVLKVQDTLREFDKQLTANADIAFIEDELKALRDQLTALDKKAMAGFDDVKQHITEHNLPDVIHQRHTDAVEKYKKEYSTLLANMALIYSAPDQATKHEALQQTRAHLDGLQLKRSQQPFDPNNLPHKSMQPNPDNKPKLTKAQFAEAGLFNDPLTQYASHGSYTYGNLAGASNPAYLAETDEVKITPFIQAKADELQHDPVQIYNWVRNNIEWIPSWGAMQDADITLGSRRGNAMDISSLLIALYRASGIPARYVHGTIEVPEDKFRNWAGGFESAEAAGSFASSGGIPVAAVVEAGNITKFQLEHIWVEAAIDYQPSRGAINLDADGWIQLDASYKFYNYSKGLDTTQITSTATTNQIANYIGSGQFNVSEKWMSGLDVGILKSATTQSVQDLENYIGTNSLENATTSQIVGGKIIQSYEVPSLSATSPYRLINTGLRYAEIHNNLKHQVTFTLGRDELRQNAGEVSLPWSKVNNHKVILSFRPTSPADEEVLQSLFPEGQIVELSQFPQTIPAYLVSVTAELKINDAIVSQGQALNLGNELEFKYRINRPGHGAKTYVSPVIAGSYLVVSTIGGSVSEDKLSSVEANLNQTKLILESGNPQQVSQINRDKLLGDSLYIGVLGYFAEYLAMTYIAGIKVDALQGMLSSNGTYGYVPRVNYLFGLPNNIGAGGLEMDLDSLAVFTGTSNGQKDIKVDYLFLTGLMSSYLEHSISEQIFSTPNYPIEGISAVKALEIANKQGQKIYQIDTSNSQEILPLLHHDVEVLLEIQSAIATGKTVVTHSDPVSKAGWNGSGYIIVDADTGEGAYKISGGTNGGWFIVLLVFLIIALLIILAVISRQILTAALLTVQYVGFANKIKYISENATTPEQEWDLLNKAVFTTSIGVASALVPLSAASSIGGEAVVSVKFLGALSAFFGWSVIPPPWLDWLVS